MNVIIPLNSAELARLVCDVIFGSRRSQIQACNYHFSGSRQRRKVHIASHAVLRHPKVHVPYRPSQYESIELKGKHSIQIYRF